MYAVSVPPEADDEQVFDYLAAQEDTGVLSFETADEAEEGEQE